MFLRRIKKFFSALLSRKLKQLNNKSGNNISFDLNELTTFNTLNYEFLSLNTELDFKNFVMIRYESYLENITSYSDIDSFYNFVMYYFRDIYLEYYPLNNENYCYTNHYYNERRKFLSLFFESDNIEIAILSHSFALPVKAFRSFLWYKNIVLGDLDSYLKEMDKKQFKILKNAYYLICVDEYPELPDFCSKGWKHVFHKANLFEVINEELYNENERFNKIKRSKNLFNLFEIFN